MERVRCPGSGPGLDYPNFDETIVMIGGHLNPLPVFREQAFGEGKDGSRLMIDSRHHHDHTQTPILIYVYVIHSWCSGTVEGLRLVSRGFDSLCADSPGPSLVRYE